MGEREGSRAGRVANMPPDPPEPLGLSGTPGTPTMAGNVEGAAELALAQRAATGDHHAFAALVRHYEPRLVAYLTPMLGDPEAARDVAQETFLAAFRALPRWRPPDPPDTSDTSDPPDAPDPPSDALTSDAPPAAPDATTSAPPSTTPTMRSSGATHPLSPWLYRIATNQALSLLRAHPPTQARAPDGDPPERAQLVGGATSSMSFEDRYAARELLQLALRRLSAADAACLVLHFVAGERYAEIGARLGMSAEAVRKRVARGLTALRVAYATLDVEAPR